MVSVKENIIIFTKYPTPGKSKTRLIPFLGSDGAARLQKKMTETVVATVLDYCKYRQCTFEIHFDGGSQQKMKDWLGADLSYKKQHGNNLGEKMATAIGQHINCGTTTILIGSDCPQIDGRVLSDAFSILKKKDVAIGPAHDGGYYLIGVRGSFSNYTLPLVFADIHWGTNTVLQTTCTQMDKNTISYDLTRKLHDIDTAEDLRYFTHYSSSE